MDLSAETIQVQALKSRIEFLTTQKTQSRKPSKSQVDQMEATIVELQRKKELQENQYRYFSTKPRNRPTPTPPSRPTNFRTSA